MRAEKPVYEVKTELEGRRGADLVVVANPPHPPLPGYSSVQTEANVANPDPN